MKDKLEIIFKSKDDHFAIIYWSLSNYFILKRVIK